MLQLLSEALLLLGGNGGRIDDEQLGPADEQTVRVPRWRQCGCAERHHVDTRTDFAAARVDRIGHADDTWDLVCALPRSILAGTRRLQTGDRPFAMLVEQIVVNPYLNGETIRLDGALRMAPK